MQKEKQLGSIERSRNVPKLRFPEFKGEWKNNKLGSISKFSKGKGISKSDIIQNGINQCIRYGELYTTYNELIDNVVSRTDVSISASVISEKNDVIIPSSGETQLDIATASCVLNEGIILGGDLNIIKSKINGVFLAYLLNNSKKKDIAKLAQGNSVVHLYNKNLSSLIIQIPSSFEQQKIAQFLTAIDSRIQTLEKKKSLLEQYKKGVLQKIFKQELRFKDDDGINYPNWERMQLSKILLTTLRKVEKPKTNYLAIGVRSHCKGTFQKPDTDPNSNSMNELFEVMPKDLIINITFAWESAIAIVKEEDEGGLVSHRFPTYTFNDKLCTSDFFKFVILNRRFRHQLDLISPGGAGRNRVLSKSEFLKLKWTLPCLEEQTKIANFLSAIEKKIDLTHQQIEHTKTYKKGLLQQMFV